MSTLHHEREPAGTGQCMVLVACAVALIALLCFGLLWQGWNL